MGDITKIQWTDHTASPWHGCSKVHTGCQNCYAERQSLRNTGVLGVWGKDGTRVKSKSFVKNCRAWNKQAGKERLKVFPSICDPFEDRPELIPWREELFEVIDECQNLIFLLLTKRPENIRRMWTDPHPEIAEFNLTKWWRNNVWLGTSVSDQKTADQYIPPLLRCRELSPVLFLSAEPLLGSIDLTRLDNSCGETYNALTAEVTIRRRGERPHTFRTSDRQPLDWVIMGGESGPNSRPCQPIPWISNIIDQCRAANVPCFVKQLGSNVVDGLSGKHRIKSFDSKGGDPEEWSDRLRVRQFPELRL